MKLRSIRGHHVRTDVLNSRSVVVDAGAHRGEFSAILKSEFRCRCILIEANPTLAASLERSGIGPVISGALAADDGHTTFYLEKNLESSSVVRATTEPETETIEVKTFSLETVLAKSGSGRIDVLKLDIEGSEFPFIENSPAHLLERIAQITVEFHDFQERFAHQELFQKARQKLEGLHFACTVMSFRSHGDVLFVNRRLIAMSPAQRIYLKLFARLAQKLHRILVPPAK